MDASFLKLIACSFLAFATYAILPNKIWHKYFFPLLNLGFIYSCSPDVLHLLPFFIFLAFGYVALKCIECVHHAGALTGLLGVIALAFIYLKKYSFVYFVPALSFNYTTLGLSYILFRVIHLCVDVHEKTIKEKITFLNYINYICSFFTFLSGPIARYQESQIHFAATKNKNFKETGFSKVAVRLIKGFFKIVTLASVLLFIHQHLLVLSATEGMSPWLFAGISFSYFLFIYANFSGYMDVVISLASLLGFNLPENFDRPYLAKNVIEFWSRWHMTLSAWFKTYVFNPMIKKMMLGCPNEKYLPLYGIAAYFVAFFLIGLWHDSTWTGVILGVCLASGVSINKIYEFMMQRFVDKTTAVNLHNNYFFANLSTGLALSFISLSLCTLWTDMKGCQGIYFDLGITGMMAAYVISSVILMFLKIAGETAVGFLRKMKTEALKDRQDVLLAAKLFALTFQVFCVVFTAMILSGDIPKIVYQGF